MHACTLTEIHSITGYSSGEDLRNLNPGACGVSPPARSVILPSTSLGQWLVEGGCEEILRDTIGCHLLHYPVDHVTLWRFMTRDIQRCEHGASNCSAFS